MISRTTSLLVLDDNAHPFGPIHPGHMIPSGVLSWTRWAIFSWNSPCCSPDRDFRDPRSVLVREAWVCGPWPELSYLAGSIGYARIKPQDLSLVVIRPADGRHQLFDGGIRMNSMSLTQHHHFSRCALRDVGSISSIPESIILKYRDLSQNTGQFLRGFIMVGDEIPYPRCPREHFHGNLSRLRTYRMATGGSPS